MRAWRARYGRLPSSYDWSRTHARRRGGEALERLREGDWPSASVVTDVYGSWDGGTRRSHETDCRGLRRRVPIDGSSVGEWGLPAVISDRRRVDRGHRARAVWERGSELGTQYLEARARGDLKTERSVVSIQIGEQLERRQGRVRALASVSDRSSEMAVEPVRRIALTQQEACRRSAVARSSSWSTSGRTCGWRAGAAGAVPGG